MFGGRHKGLQMCDLAEAFSIPSFGPKSHRNLLFSGAMATLTFKSHTASCPAAQCGVFCCLTLYFVFLFVVPDCGSGILMTVV